MPVNSSIDNPTRESDTYVTSLVLGIAAWLIFNSHLEAFYPIPWLAADGLLGNTLFFVISGLGIFSSLNKRHQGFGDYLSRRLWRLYPAVLIALAIQTIYQSPFKDYNLLEFAKVLVWPTPFTYVAIIVPMYLLAFAAHRFWPKYAALLLGSLCFATYIFGYTQSIDSFPAGTKLTIGILPSAVSYGYFGSAFALGGALAMRNNPVQLKWQWSLVLIVLAIVYVAIKYLMVVRGIAAIAYPTLHLIVLAICLLTLKTLCSESLVNKAFAWPVLGPFLRASGKLSLEIYLVHAVLLHVAFFASILFPLNILVFAIVTFLLAQILAQLTKAIRQSFAPREIELIPVATKALPIIGVVQDLRGIAALMVVFFHMACCVSYLSDTPFSSITQYGYLGVEIFFVISGFVIPYSLHGQGYKVIAFPRYMLRRIARVDPPYLATIVLIIALAFLSAHTPGFRGEAFVFPSLGRIASHIAYLNSFTNHATFNIVFWTLAIEFQFYILLGLIYPLMARATNASTFITFGIVSVLSFSIADIRLVIHYLPLFAMGMIVFQYRTNMLRSSLFTGMVLAYGMLAFLVLGWEVAVVATATALVIAYFDGRLGFGTAWLGTISYSVYLLHVPIGGRIVNLGERWFTSDLGKLFVLAAAIVITLAVSYLFHLAVEKPATKFARRIKLWPEKFRPAVIVESRPQA